MKYVRAGLLLAIMAVYFAAGMMYEMGSADPMATVVLTETVETVVEVPAAEKQWEVVKRIGLDKDGGLAELADSDDGSGYHAVITVRFNVGPNIAELIVWVPFGEETYYGASMQFPATEFDVSVKVNGGSKLVPSGAEEEGF